MAPPKAKQNKKKKPQQQGDSSKSKKESAPAPRLTLEDLDAISSDDDEGDGRGGARGEPHRNNKSNKDDDDEEWNAEALALRQAIKEGAFDRLLQNKFDKDEGDDEMEEASLKDDVESDDDEEDEEEVERDDGEQDAVEQDDEEEEEEADDDDDDGDNEEQDEDDDKKVDDEEGSSDDDEDDDSKPIAKGGEIFSRKALSTVTQELVASKKDLPWVETFCVIPPTPLPFANPSKRKAGVAAANDDGGIDVHDDLKREFAFYNMALEAVGEAKAKCKEGGVPFSRPVDFFAEMVKTDDHMAKVKDRLIFETKKMEAVAQRKSNKEQKLRVKETHDNKLADKAKRKKEHQRAVDDWAKSSQQSGGGAGGDDMRGGGRGGPNKKRLAADRKYGHGGPKGRFKQNDRKSMDDLSSFNPRGNFAGKGTKRTRSSSAGKGGGNRPGKRARDEGRARRRST